MYVYCGFAFDLPTYHDTSTITQSASKINGDKLVSTLKLFLKSILNLNEPFTESNHHAELNSTSAGPAIQTMLAWFGLAHLWLCRRQGKSPFK